MHRMEMMSGSGWKETRVHIPNLHTHAPTHTRPTWYATSTGTSSLPGSEAHPVSQVASRNSPFALSC